MKLFLMALLLFSSVSPLSKVEAREVLNQRNYTCSQLNSILSARGSIWVRGNLFQGFRSNITVRGRRPVCHGPGRSCYNIAATVTAQNGHCRLNGIRCFCHLEDRHEND